jgi:hypothetical protein
VWRSGLLVLGACGRIAFDAHGDAGGAGDGPPDVALVTYRDVVVADSPIAYWRFDDTTNVAHDEMGTYDGTYAGSCSHVAGVLAGDASGALGMDGTTCEITFGDVLAFPGRQPFTIELWVNEQPGVAHDEIYFMKETRNGPGPMDGYALLNAPIGLYLERIINTGGQNTPRATIPTGQWVYVVATYDGTQERLYIDGNLFGAASNDTGALVTYSAPCALGAFPPPISNAVDGALDELAIYAHALTPAQVAVHRDYAINGPR